MSPGRNKQPPTLEAIERDEAKLDAELEHLTQGYRRKCRPWTEGHTELVRKYYCRVPLEKLAAKLDRTSAGVQEHAQTLRDRGVKLECDK